MHFGEEKKVHFVFLIVGWMKLVQVTLLSETDWFSKQAYSSYEVLWICLCGNIENLGILDAAEKESV